jgi:hypothetical protein
MMEPGRNIKRGMLLLALLLLWPLSGMAKVDLKSSPWLLTTPLLAGNDDKFDEFGDQSPKKELPKSTQPISRTKAVILSLLLPGAGQYYAGAKGKAEVFLGAEVATWAGVLAFNTYGHWKEDDYIRYAEEHAGIDPTGKDDDFYKNLTFYDNRDEYNTDGRIINPGAPYYPNTAAYDWQWDSRTSRDSYRILKNASKSAFRKATFMIGVAVLNRIISGIDAFRAVKKKAAPDEQDEFSSDEQKIKFHLSGNPFGSNPKIKIGLSRQF